MVPSIGDFLAALHRIVPAHEAAGWDVTGLQLGDASQPATRVGVCHEINEEVTAALESNPVDLVVTYHPLLFAPTNRIVAGRSASGRAWRLARAGVAVAVAHTDFDAATGGTADALAAAIDLKGVTGFGPIVPASQAKIVVYTPPESVELLAAAMSAVGAGAVGNYTACSFRTEGIGTYRPEAGATPTRGHIGETSPVAEVMLEMMAPASRVDDVVAAIRAIHPYDQPGFEVHDVRANLGLIGRVGDLSSPVSFSDFTARVAAVLGSEGLRASGPSELAVQRVAVVPGSGSSFLSSARPTGADVFLTGDVGHHTVVAGRDQGLAVVDAGHAPTERPGMEALHTIVAGLDAETSVVDLTGFDPTPWR